MQAFHTKRIVLSALALFMLASGVSCTVQTGYTSTEVTALKAEGGIQPGQQISVGLPMNFAKGDVREDESGRKTQAAMQKALAKKGAKACFANIPASAAQGMQQAKAQGSRYYIDMVITNWDDPTAFPQLRPDRGAVSVSVYSLESGGIVRVDNVECQGQPTLVNNVGFYGPEDCLAPAFEKWWDTVTAASSL